MEENNKLDYIVENIGAINKTLEFQSKVLDEHIKRTRLLEGRLVPLETHVILVQSLLKIMLYCGSGLASLATVLHMLGKL